MSETSFRTIEPKILCFGTPMALISSLNEDGGDEPGADIVILDAGMDDSAGAS